MSANVIFLGGPMDGAPLDAPLRDDGQPDPYRNCYTLTTDRNGSPVQHAFTYRREVTQLDTGPLWVYVPDN